MYTLKKKLKTSELLHEFVITIKFFQKIAEYRENVVKWNQFKGEYYI